MAVKRIRPQQQRLTWPPSPDQWEAIDTMLETLFRAVRTGATSVTTDTGEVIALSAFALAGSNWGQDGENDGRESLSMLPGSSLVGTPGARGPMGIPGLDGDDAEANWPTSAGSATAIATGVTDAIVSTHVNMRV